MTSIMTISEYSTKPTQGSCNFYFEIVRVHLKLHGVNNKKYSSDCLGLVNVCRSNDDYKFRLMQL